MLGATCRTAKYVLHLFFMVVKANEIIRYIIDWFITALILFRRTFQALYTHVSNVECTLPQTKNTEKHEKHRGGLRGWVQWQWEWQ